MGGMSSEAGVFKLYDNGPPSATEGGCPIRTGGDVPDAFGILPAFRAGKTVKSIPFRKMPRTDRSGVGIYECQKEVRE
jgi:hypothetical protein